MPLYQKDDKNMTNHFYGRFEPGLDTNRLICECGEPKPGLAPLCPSCWREAKAADLVADYADGRARTRLMTRRAAS